MAEDRERTWSESGPAGQEEAVLDVSMLQSRFGEKDELLAAVASEYKNYVRRAGQELKEALENGDEKRMRQQAHTFKGNAALVGAKRAESLAKSVEQTAGQQDWQRAREMVCALEDAAEESVRMLEELLQSRGCESRS